MTENQLRNKVVAIMRGWLGLKEADGSHKKILDIYNAYKPLPRGYKMTTKDAWCAATVSAAFIKAGLADIGYPECSCTRMIDLYKKHGRWKESDSYVPSPGDLIMYDWDDNGVGDCTGQPEHVGMVVAVNGTYITVIEGNKNDAVGYRSMSVNGRYIRGYCLPDYASKADTKATADAVPKVEPARFYSKAFNQGFTVTASSLNMRRGPGTSHAVVKVLKNGENVRCYGYYSKINGTVWPLVVDSTGVTGYCSKKYLT